MVLQFNEAPDYASILERDYNKINRGFDRREQAERANDQRRIQNAGVPLDLIQGIAQFSATAKQLKDKLDQKKIEDAEMALNYLPDDEETNTAINQLQLTAKTDYKVAYKVENEDGDSNTATDIIKSTPWKSTGIEGAVRTLNHSANNLEGILSESDYRKQLEAAQTSSEAAAVLTRFKRALMTHHYRNDGIKKRLIDKYLDKKLDELVATQLTKKNRAITERLKAEEARNEAFDLDLAFESNENIGQRVFELIDLNQGKYGKISDSVAHYNGLALNLLAKGEITTKQYLEFKNHQIPSKGEQGKLQPLHKVFPRAFFGSDKAAADAAKSALDIKDTEKSNYLRDFKNNLEAQENERIKQGGTRFTEEEIVEYYKNNYDSSQGGPLTQQMINEWWTAEEAFDQEHDRVLNEREKLGIPISKKEANKFNNPDKRAYWSNKAITLNTSVPSEAHIQSAKKRIKAHSVKHNKLDGNPDPSQNLTYVNNTEYGLAEYRRIYAEEIQTAPSANSAHLATMKRIKDNIFEGLYDEPPTPSISAAKQRELTLKSATEAIKLNPDIINTGIIFGTEKILEEVRANPNEIHIFYKQLADRYSSNNKPVTADQLQYAQLEIAHKLFGGSKPVKSELLEAYEKLDPGVQFLLSTHPTPAKVMRAKIEAFKDDGEISYDEIEFLLEELYELDQKENPTPELKQTSKESILGWDFVTTM
tara:strand:- start:7434 stop:9551 length:2118 start_codon:yes stop_codon:yes gene_type:complete